MSIVLRPAIQKEAEHMLSLAKTLVHACGTVRFAERPGYRDMTLLHLHIAIDEADESNTMTITLGDSTKLHACWCGDDLPPLFLTYLPGFWKWQIRRAVDDLQKESA